MQTFLPYPSFEESAKCLDAKRLGKQRVEAWQIYNALRQGEYNTCKHCGGNGGNTVYPFQTCKNCKGTGVVKTAWYNHPAVRMWKGCEDALKEYFNSILYEWVDRGYKNTMLYMTINVEYPIKYPPWLGNEKFHASHRSNLLRKNKKYYSQFGWKEPNDLPYVWPIKEEMC